MARDDESDSSVEHRRSRPREKKTKRKKTRRESQSPENLLVYGYGSRIFRDDPTAASIDKEEMLIPWREQNEDPILMDRYDVRNLLDNIDDQLGPTENETDAEEQQYDEERYRDIDSEEEALFDMSEDERLSYVEEKRKRRRMEQEGKVFVYNYPKSTDSKDSEVADSLPKREIKLKYPAPDGVTPPRSTRIARIIEKTAQFINDSANPQMEIVIQAKQANNPDFSFLSTADPCHAYYKHVRLLMQTGLCAYGSGDDDDDDEDAISDHGGDAGGVPKAENMVQEQQPLWPAQPNFVETVGKLRQVSQASPSLEIPPEDLQTVIDKMARFVSKNGPEFERKVREKNQGDPRFAFLLPWNEYHAYYQSKIHQTTSPVVTQPAEEPGSGMKTQEPEVSERAALEDALDQVDAPLPASNIEHMSKAERFLKARAFLAQIKASKTSSVEGVAATSSPSLGQPLDSEGASRTDVEKADGASSGCGTTEMAESNELTLDNIPTRPKTPSTAYSESDTSSSEDSDAEGDSILLREEDQQSKSERTEGIERDNETIERGPDVGSRKSAKISGSRVGRDAERHRHGLGHGLDRGPDRGPGVRWGAVIGSLQGPGTAAHLPEQAVRPGGGRHLGAHHLSARGRRKCRAVIRGLGHGLDRGLDRDPAVSKAVMPVDAHRLETHRTKREGGCRRASGKKEGLGPAGKNVEAGMPRKSYGYSSANDEGAGAFDHKSRRKSRRSDH
ncbi:hypothetical protein HK104_010258 [Borealophlyctis nickersoniae]|nr:hypothetical protein HK104_010258 [Borealophlyctis nickersoniae]